VLFPIGEVVKVLEGGISLSACVENPKVCDKSEACLTRSLWEEATKAMHDRLEATTLAEMVQSGKALFSEL
jgi:DNA-binding IscR family transcriptional regulator